MPSRQALVTQAFLRTLVRPTIVHMPIGLQRRFVERILKDAELPRQVRVEPLSAGSVQAEMLTPERVESDRVLYYLHGGGYCFGSLKTHRHFVAALARKLRIRALHIDYRLAPEHPHPAALEDSLAAYDWLLAQGIKANDVIIGGESAGGGLTMATLLSLRQRGTPLPGLGFLLSPWLDLTMSGRSIKTRRNSDAMIPADYLHTAAKMYCGHHPANTPAISPLFADLRGLPPLLIHASRVEVLRDDAVRLHENCQAAGVDSTLKLYEGLFHAFHLFGNIPEARAATHEITEFIAARSAAAS